MERRPVEMATHVPLRNHRVGDRACSIEKEITTLSVISSPGDLFIGSRLDWISLHEPFIRLVKPEQPVQSMSVRRMQQPPHGLRIVTSHHLGDQCLAETTAANGSST